MNAFSLDAESASTSQPWRRESVRAFFEAVAWDGRAAVVTPAMGNAAQSQSPMTMTVVDFFQGFAWEGQPAIGAPIAPLSTAPATAANSELDLTLDGFSDLFG